MLRSLLSELGVNLKRKTAIINGESSSSTSAKYFIFTFQNQNVVISKSRVTSSIFYSFSTTASDSSSDVTSPSSSASNDSSRPFAVSYLMSSCGLSREKAIPASKNLKFKTKSEPDSVLNFLKTHGFTESHISKVISKAPSVLQSSIHGILQPKLDFFKSKGMSEMDLADFISGFPILLLRKLNKEIIPNYEILKGIVQSDENVITLIKRNPWIFSTDRVKRVVHNIELLRNAGLPEADISRFLTQFPKVYTANRFAESLEMAKEMGFDPLQDPFLKAVHMLTVKSDAGFRNKMDVYKRCGGWSQDQVQSAFRKSPTCMNASEEKIMGVFKFLVNEMDYDSSIVAENPIVFTCSLEGRVIPRCSVSWVLVSKGLIKEMISLDELATMFDESFLEKFVKNFEQEVPQLMKVFQGQLNYQELLQN